VQVSLSGSRSCREIGKGVSCNFRRVVQLASPVKIRLPPVLGPYNLPSWCISAGPSQQGGCNLRISERPCTPPIRLNYTDPALSSPRVLVINSSCCWHSAWVIGWHGVVRNGSSSSQCIRLQHRELSGESERPSADSMSPHSVRLPQPWKLFQDMLSMVDSWKSSNYIRLTSQTVSLFRETLVSSSQRCTGKLCFPSQPENTSVLALDLDCFNCTVLSVDLYTTQPRDFHWPAAATQLPSRGGVFSSSWGQAPRLHIYEVSNFTRGCTWGTGPWELLSAV